MVKIMKKIQAEIKNMWECGKTIEYISNLLKIKKKYIKYYITKKNKKNNDSKYRIDMETLKNAFFICKKANESSLRNISKKYSELIKKNTKKYKNKLPFFKKCIAFNISPPTCGKYLRVLNLYEEKNEELLNKLKVIYNDKNFIEGDEIKKHEILVKCFSTDNDKKYIKKKNSILLNKITTFKFFKKNIQNSMFHENLYAPEIDDSISSNLKNQICDFLSKKGIEFNDDLVYDSSCTQNDNDSQIDSYVLAFDQNMIKIYENFKNNSRNGLYGNFKIIYDKNIIIIKALSFIKKGTIICEYSGDVTRDIVQDNNYVELLKSPIHGASLVIFPKHHGNFGIIIQIAKKNSSNKNLKMIKVSINGLNHILFIAKNNINKLESLVP